MVSTMSPTSRARPAPGAGAEVAEGRGPVAQPPRRPRSRPETVRKREDILRAAADVFGTKGYAGGTLQDVASEVGITQAGVLHHFGSKAQLLLETLRYRDRADLERTGRDRLPEGRALFEHLVHTAYLNETRPAVLQAHSVLLAEALTDDSPARDYFLERFRSLREETADALSEMCAERGRDVPREMIEDAAAAVLAVMDGMQVQWLLDPERVALARGSAAAINAIVMSIVGPVSDLESHEA